MAKKDDNSNDKLARDLAQQRSRKQDIEEIGPIKGEDKPARAKRARRAAQQKTIADMTSTPAPEAIKNRNVPADSRLTPKVEDLPDPTPGQEVRDKARNAPSARPKTGVFTFDTPRRPEGAAAAASVNVTDKPEVASNLIDRMRTGMGLPGEEAGHIDKAMQLHARDLDIAKRTGKEVNGVRPDDAAATPISVMGGHHHRLAKVMHTFKVNEDVLSSHAAASGQRLETALHGLHNIAQEHEDSKRTVTLTPGKGDTWVHPTTGETHDFSHPEAPTLTRSKGKVTKVSRDKDGQQVISAPTHVGWSSVKVRGGTSVWRQTAAPAGIDLVDHMRTEMLSQHGDSGKSRNKAADIATQTAEAFSGKIPRGMKAIGTQQTGRATRGVPTISSRPKAMTTPHGSSTQPAVQKYRQSPTGESTVEPLLVPRTKPGARADKAPFPPKSKKGKMLVGGKPIPEPTIKGQQMLGPKTKEDAGRFTPPSGGHAIQPTLPGTGVPRIDATVTSPAKYVRAEGPLEKFAAARVGEMVGKHKTTETDMAPRIKVADEKISTSVTPTDRNWKPETPRGMQFAIDTTDMTGAQEVTALRAKGAFGSRSKEVELRPGGARQAKRDRKAAAAAPAKAPEQMDLFPDFKETPGRANAFYMAGGIQRTSDASRALEKASTMPMGPKEQVPASGSRGAKREEAQGVSDELNAKKL